MKPPPDTDPALIQRKLFDKWHKQAYRVRAKPTTEQVASRFREFLAMVKQCECGVWHLELDAKCKGCEKPKASGHYSLSKVNPLGGVDTPVAGSLHAGPDVPL